MDPLKPLPFLALEEKGAIVASHEVSLETKRPRCTNFSGAICIHDWIFGYVYPCPYLDTISAFLRNATILCQTEPCKSVLISVVITKYTQCIANFRALFYSYTSNIKKADMLFFLTVSSITYSLQKFRWKSLPTWMWMLILTVLKVWCQPPRKAEILRGEIRSVIIMILIWLQPLTLFKMQMLYPLIHNSLKG